MNQKKRQPRTQLRLRLERQEDTAPLTPNSQDLLEALADLLLAPLRDHFSPLPASRQNNGHNSCLRPNHRHSRL